MIKVILAAVMCVIASENVMAGKHYYYYHNTSNIMIDPYNFNEETKTAVYYDYRDGKKKTANFSDISRESKEAINGVKQGDIILVNYEGHKFCEVFHVFENGLAYFSCQVSGMRGNLGVDRPKERRYFLQTDQLTAEMDSMDGFTKKEKVTLLKDAGNIEKGSTVKVQAIFPTGEALVQKVGGFNAIDTSLLIHKLNVEKVQLSDLEKKN